MDYPSKSGYQNNTTNARTKSRVDSCFVPMCPSTSKFPNKLFLTGPSDPKMRKKWFEAAKRDDNYSPKTIIRCCEDHFNLENDLENWIKFKIFGGKLFLKKDVVPHIFECQNRMMPLNSRSAIMKRERWEIHESIENTSDTVGDVDPDDVSLASDEEDEESLRDTCDFRCNKCQKGIINCRLVCVQCADWDMCGACAARGEHPHHYLLRVPQGAEPEEVQKLLTLIRSNLRDNSEEDQSQAATVPQTSDPETEIKIEVKEELIDYEDPLHDDTVLYMDTQELPPLRLATLSKTLDTIESEAAKKAPTKRTPWEYAPPPSSSTKKIKTSQEETLETLKSNVVIIRKDKPAPLKTDNKSEIQVAQNVERAETSKVRKALPAKKIKTYTLTSNVKDTNKPKEVSSETSNLLISIEPAEEKISQEEELAMAVESLSSAFGDVASRAEGEKIEEIRAAKRLKDSVHSEEHRSEADPGQS